MDDVVIVGAGVIGLTSALRLSDAGARVTVLTADAPARTVSSVAAAVWYPTHTDPDSRVLDWATRTFDELSDQAGREVPGVVMRPTRMLLRHETGTPWWAAAVPDFREVPAAEVPPGYVGEWRFTVPSVEMLRYLDWLAEQVVRRGGQVRHHAVNELSDAATIAPSVVNATGLAARVLAHDSGVYPARGQIVLVANPGLHVSVRDEGHPDGTTYVHPRSRDVVLGGTFEPDAWDTTVDDDVAAAILRRCVALVPELAGARVLAHLVGLRPAREGGARVELDPTGVGGAAQLVHNYGHGGAGVTLSWGCADEVVRLCG